MLEPLLAVISAGYRWDAQTPKWLAGIVENLDCAMSGDDVMKWRGGKGVCAFTYRIGNDDRVCVLESHAVDLPPRSRELLVSLPPTFPPSYVQRTFRAGLCTLASLTGGRRERMLTRQQLALTRPDTGWHDVFVVNGLDATNHGLWVGVPLYTNSQEGNGIVGSWVKVAVHLAAALRLRRRLARAPSIDDAEAVVDPQGVLLHARGAATARESRQALVESVRALERLRGQSKRARTGRTLASWKGLVDARWTLVDHFECDGKRFLVATCNDVRTRDGSVLGRRERQVLAFASLGHSNKLIAYELGLAPSTVAVFLHRAARKLRVRSRAELLQKFRRLAAEASDDAG